MPQIGMARQRVDASTRQRGTSATVFSLRIKIYKNIYFSARRRRRFFSASKRARPGKIVISKPSQRRTLVRRAAVAPRSGVETPEKNQEEDVKPHRKTRFPKPKYPKHPPPIPTHPIYVRGASPSPMLHANGSGAPGIAVKS
jgi:hypothetical protein